MSHWTGVCAGLNAINIFGCLFDCLMTDYISRKFEENQNLTQTYNRILKAVSKVCPLVTNCQGSQYEF